MKRKEILDKAAEMVCGHREQDYGTPEDNFTKIAALWSAWLGIEVTAIDVAMMMVMFKAARIKTGTMTEDSFVDGAGYFACGGEIAAKIKEQDTDDTGDEVDRVVVHVGRMNGKSKKDMVDLLNLLFPGLLQPGIDIMDAIRNVKGGGEKC